VTEASAGSGERRALVVGGMHRSGTSALTRVLSLMGAELPDTLISGRERLGDEDYWESRAVVDLNQEILTANLSWWAGWQSIDTATMEDRATWLERAREVVRQEFGGSRLAVLKDPRVSRLLPLWTEALEAEGFVVGNILSLRQPSEVASSLSRRDGLIGPASALGWLAHTLDFERDSRGTPRVVVSLDNLVHDWRREVDRIGAALGLSWPRGADEVADEVDGFVSADRASRSTVKVPMPQPVHDLLVRWARDEVADGDAGFLDDWRARLEPIRSGSSPTLANNSRKLARTSAGFNIEARLAVRHLREMNQLRRGQRRAFDAYLASLTRTARGPLKGLALPRAVRRLRASGLVDEAAYVARYPEAGAAGDPLAYLLTEGRARGHRPPLARG